MNQNNPDDYLLGLLGLLSITTSLSLGQVFLIPDLFAPDIQFQTRNNLMEILSTIW